MSEPTSAAKREHKLTSIWVAFWEGALIAHFLGLIWAAAWCVAWLLMATGVKIGRRYGR